MIGIKNENNDPSIYMDYDAYDDDFEHIVDKINSLMEEYGICYEIVYQLGSERTIFINKLELKQCQKE